MSLIVISFVPFSINIPSVSSKIQYSILKDVDSINKSTLKGLLTTNNNDEFIESGTVSVIKFNPGNRYFTIDRGVGLNGIVILDDKYEVCGLYTTGSRYINLSI